MAPPPPGSFKLNTDGGFKGSLVQATGGGLIRDDKGNWIVGFHRSFRALQGLEAEFWALRDGLLLAQNKRLVPLKVEMDALAAIQLISDSNQTRHFLSNIIHDCRCLMRQLGVVKIDHAYREGNKCADLLASMSFNDDLDFHVFDVASACINSQLGEDLNGVEYPRTLCPLVSFYNINRYVATLGNVELPTYKKGSQRMKLMLSDSIMEL
ncbi:hypothetical protein Vadar_013667 [Vaccinium darrowii]|uniref:Uncharacterized protein n=1 Tax=Vaccinium darrowii TaxID=229202 RepID=A0ACB7Y0E7_9ERIC|nr:hypothetical protein Vadar_013667 [Vaccinium darrowii]